MDSIICTSLQFTSNNQHCINSTKRKHFTTEDIDLLILVHPDIVKVDDDHEIDAWNTWAHEYPQHTAQQWRNYYKYHVKPQQEALASRKPKPTPLKKTSYKDGAVAEQDETRPSMSSTLSYKNCQETIQVSPPSKQVTQYQKGVETNEFSKDTAFISEAQLFAYDQMLHDQELFALGLQDLAYELDLEVNFNPEICGRKISLMRLWRTVQFYKYSGFDEISDDRFWPKIASEFGFDNSAAAELNDCYSEILSDFGNLRREFLMEGLLNESQGNHFIKNHLPSNLICAKNEQFTESEDSISFDSQIVQHDSDDLDIPLIQEELQVSSRDISHESDQSRGRFIPKKSQRIKNRKRKALEIPSTPENKINSYRDPDLAQKRSPNFDIISDETDKLEQMNQTPSNRHHNTRKSNLMRNSYSLNKELNNDSLSVVEIGPKKHLNARVKTKTIAEDEDEDLPWHQENSMKDNETSVLSSNVVKFKNSTDVIDETFSTQDNLSFEIRDDERLFNQGLKDSYYGQNTDLPCSEQREKLIVRQCLDASCYPMKQIRTEVDTEELDGENELDAFIREQVFNSHISQDIVVKALEATSLSIGPKSYIEQVMDSLMNDEGIPDHLPGVWTASDDEKLKKAFTQPSEVPIDSTVYQDLVKKHGIPNIKLRQMYWRDMEEDEEDSDNESE